MAGGNPTNTKNMLNKIDRCGRVFGGIPLLMTASVSTRGMKGACFSDEERELMYVSALSFYIDNLLLSDHNYSIVFADNSGWDLNRIIAKIPEYDKERIEFISLSPDEFDISKGKGYNELLLINKTIEQSALIKKAGCFFKVTGRYPIYNIRHFIDKADGFINRQNGDFYADIKDHKLYDWLRLGWNGHSFDCRLFGVKVCYYNKHIAPLYVKCNDYNGNLLEGVLFDFVKHNKGKMSLRFDLEPHFGGLEGSNIAAVSFSKDQDSLKGTIKRCVGDSIRLFMPWFKF